MRVILATLLKTISLSCPQTCLPAGRFVSGHPPTGFPTKAFGNDVERVFLRWVLASIVVFVMGCSAPIQHIAPRTEFIREMERRTFTLVNEYRVSQRLKPLEWSDIIGERALRHSERMASNRVRFSHAGFENRVKEIAAKMQVRNSSENVGVNWGYDDPVQKFVEGWIASKGHLENIVGDFEFTGVGIAKSADGSYYATQIFVLTR
ncbi:MAG: CAP domain-containing protein [Ignavibacteriae bacterium]|nr:CAP domain-containing protein [Ignavibacteriota bacterium]